MSKPQTWRTRMLVDLRPTATYVRGEALDSFGSLANLESTVRRFKSHGRFLLLSGPTIIVGYRRATAPRKPKPLVRRRKRGPGMRRARKWAQAALAGTGTLAAISRWVALR